MYGVQTFQLNKSVKRNRSRFPPDFMLRLTSDEFRVLRFQIGISSSGEETVSRWGGRRYLPYAFTEQGVAMLSSVLRGERAVRVNIAIMRAFVQLREMLSAHSELAQKLSELERRVGQHDGDIRSLFDAIRQLTASQEAPRARIGFKPPGR